MARVMTVQDRSEFVPVAEAARRLGLSLSTVKRRVRDGTLEAEQHQRRQGTVYRVRVPWNDPAAIVDGPRNDPGSSKDRPPSESVAPFTIQPGTTHDLSDVIATATGPLQAIINERDATIAGHVLVIRELERENGRLSAALETVQERLTALDARTAPAAVEMPTGPAESPRVLWGRLWPALSILVAFVALAVSVLR